MGWGFIWLMLFLKIPIAGLLGLVWWAVRQQPDTAPSDDDGGSKVPPLHPHHRRPRHPYPRRPRRGPHGAPQPPSPARVRAVVARARRVQS